MWMIKYRLVKDQSFDRCLFTWMSNRIQNEQNSKHLPSTKSSWIFLSVRKIAVKFSSLSEGSALCQSDGRNNGGSVGGGASATDAWALSRRAPSAAANHAALGPPKERMSSALCFWDNQTTHLLPSSMLPLLNGLNIDHNNPENWVIIFYMRHCRGLCCLSCVVEGHLWQI